MANYFDQFEEIKEDNKQKSYWEQFEPIEAESKVDEFDMDFQDPNKVTLGDRLNTVKDNLSKAIATTGQATMSNRPYVPNTSGALEGGVNYINDLALQVGNSINNAGQSVKNAYNTIANKPINLMPSRLMQPVSNAFSGVGRVASDVLPYAMGGYYNSPKDIVDATKQAYNYGVEEAKRDRQEQEMNPINLAESLVDMYTIGKFIPGNKATMLGRMGVAGKTGAVYGGLESLKHKGINPKENLKDAAIDAALFATLEPLAEIGFAAAKEGVKRINPANYQRIIESVPKKTGTGLSQRTVYEPKVKYEYKPNVKNEYGMKEALNKPRIEANKMSDSAAFELGESSELKYGVTRPIKEAPKKTVVDYLAPNIAAKQQAKALEKAEKAESNYEQVIEEARKHTIKTGEQTRVTKNDNGMYKYEVVKPEVVDVDAKIAELERKMKLVGGEKTQLGQKYQRQIEELRGTEQAVTPVAEEIKAEITEATKPAEVQNVAVEKPKNVAKNTKIRLKKGDSILASDDFYSDGNYIVKKSKFTLEGQNQEVKDLPNAQANMLWERYANNPTIELKPTNRTWEGKELKAVEYEYTDKNGDVQTIYLPKKQSDMFKGYDLAVSEYKASNYGEKFDIVLVKDGDEVIGFASEIGGRAKKNIIETTNNFVDTVKQQQEKAEQLKQAKEEKAGRPVIKYSVKVDKYNNITGMYMENDVLHTDGNSAFYNKFVMPDKTGVQKVTPFGESALKTVNKMLETTANYTTKLEDIGKIAISKNPVRGQKIRVFEADINGKKQQVFLNEKYLLDKKNLELYANDVEPQFNAISIRRNGEQIGLVMPIRVSEYESLVDVPKMKVSNTTKPVEKVKKVAKTTEKTPKNTEKSTKSIEDVGEFLQGNRKIDKSLTWDDLDEMNDLVRAKNTTKAKIYTAPKFDDLKAEGYSDFGSALIMNVYKKINAKPAAGYTGKENEKLYVDMVNDTMKTVKDYIKNNPEKFTDEVLAERTGSINPYSYHYKQDDSLFYAIFPDKENKKGYYFFRHYPEYNRKSLIVGGSKFNDSLRIDYHTLKDVSKIIEESKALKEEKTGEKVKKQEWEKTFTVLEPSRWDNRYAVAFKKGKQIIAKFNSKAEAELVAQRAYEKLKQQKENEKSLDSTRKHIERRKDGRDVTAQELKDEFGFRGVNFGNWVNQKERQSFTNNTYDALFDLSEMLNLPNKALSLNGELGIAFGAQGHGGKAAAHYIPAFKEINLTKEHGAGSLAHEWWHAVDNYFGNKASNKEFSESWGISLKQKGEVREEVFNALKDLHDQIKTSPLTKEDLEKYAKYHTDRINGNINRYAEHIKNSYRRAKNADELNKIIDDLANNREKYKDYSIEQMNEFERKFFKLLPENRDTFTNRGEFSWLTGEIRRLARVEELAKGTAKKSEYLKSAEKLDKQEGTKYWSEDTELGARAFSVWLLDKMEKQSILNRFLVRQEHSAMTIDEATFKKLLEGKEDSLDYIHKTPIVTEEKARIFKAFDKLFDTIKTRETEKGVELYDINRDSETIAKNIQGAKVNVDGLTGDTVEIASKSDVYKNPVMKSLLEDLKGLQTSCTLQGELSGKFIHNLETGEKRILLNPKNMAKTTHDHEVGHAIMDYFAGKDPSVNRRYLRDSQDTNNKVDVLKQFIKNNERVLDEISSIKKANNINADATAKDIKHLLSKEQYKVYRQYDKLYFNYKNSYVEQYADSIAFGDFIGDPKEFIQLYDKIKPIYDKLIQEGKIYGTSEEFRKLVRQFKTNKRTRSIQRLPEKEIRSGRINKESMSKGINLDDIQRDNFKATKNIEQTVRDKVYDWHGGIGKDRYDVDKTLNSFIRMSKNIAKDISQKTGLKVSDKQLREMLPFLRERTNIPEKLDRDDLKKIFNALSGEEKARLVKFADDTSNKFEKYYKNYLDAKGEVDEATIENHISHIWDLDDKKQALLTNYITTKSRFAKQRTIETLAKGINGIEIDGKIVEFKPKTLDYAEILKSSSDNLIKATYDMQLAETIKGMKDAEGNPLVLPAHKAPADWIEVSHPALNKAVYMGTVGEDELPMLMKSSVKVHPDLEKYVASIFETPKTASKFWKGYDSINGILKQSQLGFSGFHGYALSESALANMGLKKTLESLNVKKMYDAVKNGNYEIYEHEAEAKRAIEAGVQLGTPSDLNRNLVEETLNKIPVLGKYISGAVGVNNKILWDVLHNNFKLFTFNTKIAELEKAGKVTKEQERAVAQWVNDTYGGQSWELLGVKNSDVRKAGRVLLSPDWNFSTVRQALGSINKAKLDKVFNDTKAWKRVAELMGVSENIGGEGVRGKIARDFWIRAVVYSTIFYNAMNAAFRADDRKKHPERYPKNMKPFDYSIWSNANPMDNWYEKLMPYVFIGRNSDGTARMLRVGKQFREVPELAADPITKLSGKSASIIGLLTQVAVGMSPADIVKKVSGREAYLNQNIWEGYGEDARMRDGMEAVTGRLKVAAKGAAPFMLSKYMDGKHEPSAWDMFAQTSVGSTKGKVYKEAKEAFEAGREDKIREIKQKAYRDGVRKEDINKMVGYAEKNYKADNTKKYRKKFVEAMKNKDKKELNRIKSDMQRHHLSAKEQRRIYESAYKKYLQER